MTAIKDIDTFLFFLINHRIINSLFDYLMPFITDKSYYVLLPFVIWMFIRDKKKAASAVLLSLLSLIISDMAVHTFKDLIARPRPFMVLDDVRLLVGKGRSFAMPSGHSANAFAVILPLITFFSGFLRPFLIFSALLVGFSRVYVGVHYPSDVLVGICVGILSASFVLWSFTGATKKLKEGSYFEVLLILIAGISLFRIFYIFTGPLDLSPDEAHYWDWTRRLDLSYYSKGPMIAYLIALGTALFGDTVFGIRIGAVILSALSSIILFFLTRRIYDEKTAFYSGILFQFIPLFSTYGIIMTIDAPFTFFWILSLSLLWLITDRLERGENKLWLWIALGISVGLGLLAKYTMALFFLCSLLFMLSDKRLRQFLKTPHPYVGFLFSIITFLPVIIWNAMNDWVTFRHTAGQAHVSEGFVITFNEFLEFIGSQLGVVTPILFILMLIALVRMRRDTKGRFLLWFSVPVFAFFFLKSIQGKVQANWAMTAYITGIIAVSYYYLKGFKLLRKGVQIIAVLGLCLSVFVTVVAHYPKVLKLPPDKDPTVRLRGWEDLGKRVTEIAEKMDNKGEYFIFSNRYQVTSELAFYVKGNPATYCANTGRRMNQYDLWPGFENLKNYNAIFVTMKNRPMPGMLNDAFDRCEKSVLGIVEKGMKIKTYSIFECYNFRGIEKPPIYSY